MWAPVWLCSSATAATIEIACRRRIGVAATPGARISAPIPCGVRTPKMLAQTQVRTYSRKNRNTEWLAQINVRRVFAWSTPLPQRHIGTGERRAGSHPDFLTEGEGCG